MTRYGYKHSGTGLCIGCGIPGIEYWTNRLLKNGKKPIVCNECLEDFVKRREELLA